jgi:hypothetical protein
MLRCRAAVCLPRGRNLMSHARKLSPGWYFVVVVVAASILAAAVVAMRYSVCTGRSRHFIRR